MSTKGPLEAIAGCAMGRRWQQALELLRQMPRRRLTEEKFTRTSSRGVRPGRPHKVGPFLMPPLFWGGLRGTPLFLLLFGAILRHRIVCVCVSLCVCVCVHVKIGIGTPKTDFGLTF